MLTYIVATTYKTLHNVSCNKHSIIKGLINTHYMHHVNIIFNTIYSIIDTDTINPKQYE